MPFWMLKIHSGPDLLRYGLYLIVVLDISFADAYRHFWVLDIFFFLLPRAILWAIIDTNWAGRVIFLFLISLWQVLYLKLSSEPLNVRMLIGGQLHRRSWKFIEFETHRSEVLHCLIGWARPHSLDLLIAWLIVWLALRYRIIHFEFKCVFIGRELM